MKELSFANRIFYRLKPIIPRALQLLARRILIRHKLNKVSQTWPIDEAAGESIDGWSGWPEGKKFALVLMHDVDTQAGHDKCRYLMDLEEELEFRSTFNFVAERYKIDNKLLREVRARGFGLGVHGLKHDGKLFASRSVFLRRSKKINMYLADWGTRGFSSPSMLRNLQWMMDLNIEYSTSTFDTDPFEPQPEGARTIFPFWVQGADRRKGYVELPYTMPQDFTLFILMKEKNARIWEKKIIWLARKGGMALMNSHPDYMNFRGIEPSVEEYDVNLYRGFLRWVKEEYGPYYWHALSAQVADYHRAHSRGLNQILN